MLGVRIPPGLPCIMIKRIKNYIQNIMLEWQKVTKPDAEQVRGSTIVVLIASAMLGVFIWLVDGSPANPVWTWPANIVLIAIPIAVFVLGRDSDSRRLHITAIACVPLVVVLVSTYVLNLDEPLKGFGMSFLRELFLSGN
ncbi:preprotein translocase subunit SecE [Candidatus Poribacteria bacterium]|nr:preprotein translocase subunit SecE [Candidatus Poribacteria bacterium]